MHKKVLTQVDTYYGEVETPKGFEIDRDEIRNNIIEAYAPQKRNHDNPRAFAFDDYQVTYTPALSHLCDYIRDHWRAEYGKTLITKNIFGNVMKPQEKSWTRNQVEPVDLKNSPDYTLIYGVDVKDGSSNCVVEYDNNRRKNRSWHMPIKNNNFFMFPASNKYYFTPNLSKGLNVILTVNYEFV